MSKKGTLYRIAGPVVVAVGIQAGMYEVVRIGNERLMGEVIQIDGEKTIIQVYEDTSGIKPGEPVEATGLPLSVELGPGLLTSIYDGIQRPLPVLKKQMGDFITRGVDAPGLDHNKKWDFKALVKNGDKVAQGQIIGEIEETPQFKHKVMVPLGAEGKISGVKDGKFSVDDIIAKVGDTEIRLMQKWPIRVPRHVAKKLAPEIPLITGQRIYDALFPLAKGGVAAIPGPFGSGKCVTGDTLILMNNSLKPIKEIYEEALLDHKNKVYNDGHETIIELKKPLVIYTFNKDKIGPTYATHLYRGKTSQVVEIKTRSGRTIRLTPLHKLFKVDEELKIIEKESMHLREGDYILSPRRIEIKGDYQNIEINFEARLVEPFILDEIREIIDSYIKQNKITKKELAKRLDVPSHTLKNFYTKQNKPTYSFVKKLYALAGKELKFSKIKTERQSKIIRIPSCLDEDFAEFLGYIMSDGMVAKLTVRFFNQKRELRERVSYLIEKLFGLKTTEYLANTVMAIRVASRPLVNLLASLGMPLKQKSRNVGLPKGLLQSPESVIKSFLKAYISCDGHVWKKELEITSASQSMQSGLSYLLLRLGILFRAGERDIKGRTYYRIFIPPREAVKLADYYPKRFYYNSTDVVPITSSFFRNMLGEVKPWQLEKQGIPTSTYYSNVRQTTKTFQKAVQALDADQRLKIFAKALDYVFCDEILSVEIVKEDRDVYDITVPKTHNFVGGHIPMILHNTVTQQALAKWADAKIIVYIGCGERGNEMTEVLTEFPELIDPKSGRPLMDRTVLIANTSNMPVAAREASIYTGITIAEYYRDMGYDVALMADSTSRWAEAMREISSRLEEMPGEEGYPAYLATRLAEFYERAGRVIPLGTKEEGSVSVIGAVSPPGGDFSEPVTQNTLRVTKAFWALDAKLAQRRHFPAINWLTSYSLYLNILEPWYATNVAADWRELITKTMSILQEEEKLMEIVQLVGSDALPEKEQLTLEIARMFREFFLQQNALHEVDTYSELRKTYRILKVVNLYANLAYQALQSGARVRSLIEIKAKDKIAEIRFTKEYEKKVDEIEQQLESEFAQLKIE